MRNRLACLPCLLAAVLAPAPALAQGGLSQAKMEDDCLQRLRLLIPQETKPQRVDFSALGNYATYYVVSYRFAGDLKHGSRTATCTYRRDGAWVRDDAASYQLARDLEPKGARPHGR